MTNIKQSPLFRWGLGLLLSPLPVWALGIIAQRLIMVFNGGEITGVVEGIGFFFLSYIYYIAPLSALAGIVLIGFSVAKHRRLNVAA